MAGLLETIIWKMEMEFIILEHFFQSSEVTIKQSPYDSIDISEVAI